VDFASDELTRPLGLDPPRPTLRLPRIPAGLLIGAALTAVAAASVYVATRSDPLAGVPQAVVPQAVTPIVAAPVAPAPPRVDPARVHEVPTEIARRSGSDIESASGVSVIRGDGTSAPESLVITIPDEPGTIRLKPAPDERLVEQSRHGLLPKIGRDGSRASTVYARPPGALPGGVKPVARIALVVGGLGLSEAATADALETLPPATTLAFAPYGRDLQAQVTRARTRGHEVLLQVPMEPFDYPANDPGPHTLTAAARPQDNLDKLQWLMARFSGYVGVVNFMGAKIMADEAALAPLMREIGGRGLGFIDDGSSPRSLAAKVGPGVRTPTGRAAVVLDGVPRADALDKELARVESLARERGYALATASALPVTLERVGRWARGLEAKGILLVPASVAFETGR
jgi:polysaccharide deacetylase 2 family uncharacterized protein YibQ